MNFEKYVITVHREFNALDVITHWLIFQIILRSSVIKNETKLFLIAKSKKFAVRSKTHRNKENFSFEDVKHEVFVCYIWRKYFLNLILSINKVFWAKL